MYNINNIIFIFYFLNFRYSKGAFSVDLVEPLTRKQVKTYPVAYQVTASAAKLSRKDTVGLGKSDPFFKVIIGNTIYYNFYMEYFT